MFVFEQGLPYLQLGLRRKNVNVSLVWFSSYLFFVWVLVGALVKIVIFFGKFIPFYVRNFWLIIVFRGRFLIKKVLCSECYASFFCETLYFIFVWVYQVGFVINFSCLFLLILRWLIINSLHWWIQSAVSNMHQISWLQSS